MQNTILKNTILLIDAGYLKKAVKKTGFFCDKEAVVKIANKCYDKTEDLLKVLYYDCKPFDPVDPKTGKIFTNPKTGKKLKKQDNSLIRNLEIENLFAVRLGKLKFNGWLDTGRPSFRQKGVDMRIGLDIANISHQGKIDRIILITADTDFIPAMKYARKSSIQIVLIQLEKNHLSHELKAHSDIIREIAITPLELTKYKNKE